MAIEEEAPVPLYRPARALPFELIEHSGIFFEEKLYTQALKLLLNILTSGTVASAPAYIPTPPQLAVAATFLVHPSTTTRAKTTEEKDAAAAALRLLRLTNTLIGSKSAKFDLAFSFTHFESSRRGGRRRADDEAVPSETDETRPLNLDLGQSASIWSRAEDFWHAVGWAFNCSVLHPERWERWQIWLQFMCEVLEDDWNERKREFDRSNPAEEENPKSRKRGYEHPLEKSLIFRYIAGGSAGYGRDRRILRAIFADGTATSTNEFREVFHNELKRLKNDNQNIKKREVEVNIDEGEYGDYLANDEDESDEPDTAAKRPARRPKRTRKGTRSGDPSADAEVNVPFTSHANGDVSLLGGLKSLALRQRLLHLLSDVSESLPQSFTTLEEIYHLFVENIRHLPLPIFQAFVSPSVLPHFSAAAQTTLCEFLLFRMRENAAPDTDEQYLNQTKLEQCFLPYAASTASVVDNTKMSIVLESLVILLADSDLLRVTPLLKTAVQDGIIARADKAQVENRRNQNSRRAEDIEWCWLLESGERLMFLVDEVLPQEDG
ncbi:hypothetical protein ASPWEDRAFT_33794 [Aspergillus wentii DTO 134E9]|uniref:Uncharacterized protein n=1 Tax=Aspergillus wentii DTO 134E9 TaxID=1073089 RepID=A0A1L9RZQ1_ASPWE|nr:uncharacterized protein ASPWEDRAFT_33794 [Aspergillus wentii DTO 134E9]KAI9932827.1 hypothetical protein MW887_009079 [Aspergillus wentii]OJJ40409.1 hypothetical protein ASPWEDRAFT_33794 [Aspergillus wentii DTO 134E9]